MKPCACISLLFALLPLSAVAEATYPDWDTICPDDQRELGFHVYRSDNPHFPSFGLTVPPAIADVCSRVRLYMFHRGNSQERVEVNAALEPQRDGSAKIAIDLWDASFDHAELILYIDHRKSASELPRALLLPRLKDCVSTDHKGDFDGFTFRIPGARRRRRSNQTMQPTASPRTASVFDD